MALDFVAGCVGGCAGVVVGYPLDTIKVHMQTQDYRNPKYKGNWDCFRSILAKESVVGLYRGMSSPMAGVGLVNAIIFGVYGQTQKHIPNPDSLFAHFIAGTLAGIAQTPICSPIELTKTRMQLQVSSTRFSGPLQCLKHTYKYEGIRGVFRGLGITFLREAPSFGIYFTTYEALTKTSENKPVSTGCMLLAGGLAGSASWMITYPLDVVKSRIQADSKRYAGMLDCLKQSVKAEGYSCLYRGLGSTILRAFPTNAVTFAVVAWTFRIFGQETNEAPIRNTKSGMVESAKKVSEAHEPFLGKWNAFLTSASNGMVIPTLSMVSSTDLTLANSVVYQVNRWTETGIRHSVADQVRSDTCHVPRRGRVDIEERERG
ncbi:mitochondrial basic amino acids transporter-like isoform X1 [Hylaeus anthracinus]|uniref:mitochondrial basic amino acids transporter-like isoform X1 n=2 Tax=Hylaeus anthracinus TaxID=313031 RepID=UPI0023B989AD|nr:mitochondrial basic amino acids transporter-like isoform X1 [Hylaeus anthracinus]